MTSPESSQVSWQAQGTYQNSSSIISFLCCWAVPGISSRLFASRDMENEECRSTPWYIGSGEIYNETKLDKNKQSKMIWGMKGNLSFIVYWWNYWLVFSKNTLLMELSFLCPNACPGRPVASLYDPTNTGMKFIYLFIHMLCLWLYVQKEWSAVMT